MIIQTPYEMFAKSAALFPEKVAIVFVSASGREETYSYRELLDGVEYLARELSTVHKLQKGERACFLLPNSPAFVTAYLACSKIGVIPVLLNPALPLERVNNVLKETEAKILFVGFDPYAYGLLYKVRDILNNVPIHTLDTDFPKVVREYDKAKPVYQAEFDPEDIAAILYSSGTTGPQKAVELTVSNVFFNTYYACLLNGITPYDMPICFLPLSHCFGINYIALSCLRTGATLVLHEKFDQAQVLESLRRNKVTIFFAVPAIYRLFLKSAVEPTCFDSVRYFFYAADSLPVESIRAWEDKFGHIIITAWGLTETSPLATFNHPAYYELGSVGTPIPGVEIKIVDEDGALMPRVSDPDKTREFLGEICVRGHCVMKGYLNRAEATAEVMRDGWFHTGDIGYLNDKGFLFVVDRKKDMINVGGEKAWPREIEGILARHPQIRDVGVVGGAHDSMGEVPLVAIVLEDSEDESKPEVLKDILFFARAKLLEHECPHRGNIVFTDNIPRNPSGKILRIELKKLFV